MSEVQSNIVVHPMQHVVKELVEVLCLHLLKGPSFDDFAFASKNHECHVKLCFPSLYPLQL